MIHILYTWNHDILLRVQFLCCFFIWSHLWGICYVLCMYLTVVLDGENRCCPCLLEACRQGLTKTMWTPRTMVTLPCRMPQGWESEDLFSHSWEAGGGAHASTLCINLFPEVRVRIWGQAKWPWSFSPASCSFIFSLSVVTPFSTHFCVLKIHLVHT